MSVPEPSYRKPFTGTDPGSTFGSVLDVGSDGTWTGALTGAAYRLSNAVDGGAVRYYYLMGLPGEAGPLAQGTIGVTVGMAPGGGGIPTAGLIFDFDSSNGNYLAFALTSTGFIVLQRGSSGLELLVDETLDSLRPNGHNRLELRSFGTSVEVVVNGATAATLNGERPFYGGVAIVALALAAVAFAQAPAYENPALGFRLVPPAGWASSEDLSPEGMLLLQFTAPSGPGAVGLVAVPILEVDRAFWTGPRELLVQDVWEGFLPEVPDAQITQSYEVGDVAGFTFFSAGDREHLQTAQDGLESLVAGFSFLRAGGPASGMGGIGAAVAGGSSGRTNPLDGASAGSGNPLDGAATGPVGDPHVGVFADERLQLTLEPSADGLAGEIVFDGARFPVTARPLGGGVAGQFVAGSTLTFVTDDARYVLQRVSCGPRGPGMGAQRIGGGVARGGVPSRRWAVRDLRASRARARSRTRLRSRPARRSAGRRGRPCRASRRSRSGCG